MTRIARSPVRRQPRRCGRRGAQPSLARPLILGALLVLVAASGALSGDTRGAVTPSVWEETPGGSAALSWQASDAPPRDRLSARFARCHGGGGDNCVIDGDTFQFAGKKIRIADIDTPETHSPVCAAEAERGARATDRLLDLLNSGPFSLNHAERNTDRYGRTLRTVTRDGARLGERLVAEGLARHWDGSRRPWC